MNSAPEIIIFNGHVLTMDTHMPTAEALAISGGRIIAVGANEDIRQLSGSDTLVIDSEGKTVLPGFIDSHVHLFQGSAALERIAIDPDATLEDIRTGVQKFAFDRPSEPLIMCLGTPYGLIDGKNPTRRDLDEMLPDRPLALVAPDLHVVWANTLALEKAGLLHGAPMPDGSTVVMGADGLANGELLETGAFGPVLSLASTGGRDMLGYVSGRDPDPSPTLAQREADKDLLARGLKFVASRGITTLHNMDGNFYQLELLQELDDEGRLPCRVQIPFHLKNFDPIDRLEEAVEMRSHYASPKVWSGRVKMFMDGVIESRTALMLRPYPDRLGNTGEAIFEPEHFNEACIKADALGLQICVHAIGDLAVRRTLDGYEAAIAKNGKRDARHRIEHVETIHPDDIPRFAELGVVASMQPRHAPFGGYFPAPPPQTAFHDDQLPFAYPWKTLRENGARLVFSTDWPVVPLDVLPNLQSAIAPTSIGNGWGDQSQSLNEALSAYTVDNAWVEFSESEKGKIKTGMLADVVMLDRNIEMEAPDRIGEIEPVFTICAGVITFSREA